MAETLPEVTLVGPSGHRFTVGVLQEDYLIGREHGVPMVCQLYDDRCIHYAVDLLQERPRHKFATNVMIAGEPRTGKSTLGISMARLIDHGFSPDKVAFTLEDFTRIFSANPYADPKLGVFPQVIADESGFSMYSQNFMDREQRNLNRMFQVTPVMNQISYFILPHKDFLNKNLRDTMVQYWFQTVVHNGLRGVVKMRQAQHSEFVKDVYWQPVCAFTFSAMDRDAWWTDYFKRKVEFVNRVAAEPLGDLGTTGREKEIIGQRNRAIKALYLSAQKAEPISHKKVAELMDMPVSTVDSILNRARPKGKHE